MLSNGIVSAKNLHGFAELIRSDRPNPFSLSLLSNILYQSSAFFEAAIFSDPLRNFAEQIQRKALNLSTKKPQKVILLPLRGSKITFWGFDVSCK